MNNAKKKKTNPREKEETVLLKRTFRTDTWTEHRKD